MTDPRLKAGIDAGFAEALSVLRGRYPHFTDARLKDGFRHRRCTGVDGFAGLAPNILA
jgi:hypothetical protein